MSDSWDIDALRTYLSNSLGPKSPSLAVVDSLDRYVGIFLYHLYTARDAMKGVVHTDDPYGLENSKYIFGLSVRQNEYHKAMVVTEANTLGCIHATRAIYDVFSHLLNDLLLCGVIGERQCEIASVAARLPDSQLKQILDSLLGSQWFSYVTAFINTAKHRRLVGQFFYVSFEDGSAGLHIPEFSYNGKAFTSYPLEEVLRGVVDVKNSIVYGGRALNSLLGVASG